MRKPTRNETVLYFGMAASAFCLMVMMGSAYLRGDIFWLIAGAYFWFCWAYCMFIGYHAVKMLDKQKEIRLKYQEKH